MTEPKRPYVIQDSTNRLTIAIQIDSNNQIRMAVAMCNPKDQYSRKVGFQKAHYMLNSPKAVIGTYTGADWKADFLQRVKAVIGYRAERVVGLASRPAFRKSLDVLESWAGRHELREDILNAVKYAPNVQLSLPVTSVPNLNTVSQSS